MDGDAKVGLLFSIGVEDYFASSMQLYYCEMDNFDDEDKNNSTRFSLDTLTKIDHPPVDIHHFSYSIVVGSCNGLVCIYDTRNDICDPTYICNPITGEYINLPPLREKPCDRFDHTASGFGYCQSTNEYKVVRIFYYKQNRQAEIQVDVQVYTLGDNRGWRNKQVTTRYNLLGCSPGVFVDGALHWKDFLEKQVVAFDLGTEEFQTLPDPPCVTIDWGIQVLGGFLCAVDIRTDNNCVDIWGFKNSGEEPRNWSKEFSIDFSGYGKLGLYCWPLILTKNNEILLWYEGKILFVYNPRTKTLKKLWNDGDGYTRFREAIPHVNTLVSLQDLGEKSKSHARIAD